jgi:cardiolipin synthase (CMP-forming)
MAAMTTANKISILRVLLVPFFVALMLYYANTGQEVYRLFALVCFAVAAISDGVDGYIARRYNQRSELGAVLDPLADKLLLVSALVLLSLDTGGHFERLPLWLVITVLGRDAILALGTYAIHHYVGKTCVRPHLTGKIATVLQMTAVLWALFLWDARWLWWWCLGAALFTGVSGVLYVLDGVRQLSASPRSAATKS